jgi:hypothetical protein
MNKDDKLDKVEKYLKKKIFPDLEKGRGDFDKIHTIEVVDWIKKIIQHNPNLKLDKVVLVIAAYAHDWGYYGLFGDRKNLKDDEITKLKPLHMELGAKKLNILLKEGIFSFLSDEQKNRCVHLVFMHDKKFELNDIDELILLEADSLSGMDVGGEKPVFDVESNKTFMASIDIRISKFVTNYSKNEAKKLLRKRKQYFAKL